MYSTTTRSDTRSHRTTSTVSNFYTGLKLGSKTHFYGRAAAEEVLASFLCALLRPRSGRRGFSGRNEHNLAADRAVAAGATEQRPRRAAAAAANAAMDALEQRGELA